MVSHIIRHNMLTLINIYLSYRPICLKLRYVYKYKNYLLVIKLLKIMLQKLIIKRQ